VPLFPNVSSVGDTPNTWEGSLESSYLREFFLTIQRLNPSLFSSFEFEILHLNTAHRNLTDVAGGPKKVLVWLSDEASSVPIEACKKYAAVFKSYWLNAGPIGNIYPFPLCGSNEVHATPIVPMRERTTSVFFSGNFCPNRAEFFRAFTKFAWVPPFPVNAYPIRRVYYEFLRYMVNQRDFSCSFADSSISFTGGFRKGLPPAEFAKALANSKIALCPEGFRSTETIRAFEALRLGCVVISPRMPPNKFYHGSPLIQVHSWLEINKIASSLIADQEMLQNLHYASLEWWQKICSAKATALEAYQILARLVD